MILKLGLIFFLQSQRSQKQKKSEDQYRTDYFSLHKQLTDLWRAAARCRPTDVNISLVLTKYYIDTIA